MASNRVFTRQVMLSTDLRDNSLKFAEHYGRTDKHSTGLRELDEYLWGGYGRHEDWEMLVLHGAYKSGKTTVALNMLRGAIEAGTRVGIFPLEEGPERLNYRLALALDDPNLEGNWQRQVRWLPKRKRGERRYKLAEVLDEMQEWYTDPVWGVDIILVDHMQFMYDSALPDGDVTQWVAQTQFVQDLNALLDEVKKTAILVSQENRQGEVAGSIGIPRAATKLMGVSRIDGEPSVLSIKLEPSRGTPPRAYGIRLEQRDERLYVDGEQCAQFKREIGDALL